MAKVTYDGIKFDSDLEVNYYKHLKEKNILFKYHLPNPIELDFMEKGYTPDFIEFYPLEDNPNVYDCIIRETKGYNQFSARMDTIIHNSMNKIVRDKPDLLREWLKSNSINVDLIRNIGYQKTKYLKAHGFVDFKFKPPGHKDAWKNRCLAAEEELKESNRKIKKYKQHFKYSQLEKLTKVQQNRLEELKVELENDM